MADRPVHPRSPGGSSEPSWMTSDYWTEDTSLEDRKQQGKFLYHLADNLIGFEDEYETKGERFGKAVNQATSQAMEDPIGFGIDLGREWRDSLERIRYGPLAYAKEDYTSVYDIPPEKWTAMEEEWNAELMNFAQQPMAPGASSLLTRTPSATGIFAGNAAVNQRHSKSAAARLMKEDGVSDREIYDATGYQYSPEQKDWQFVISPKDMQLNSKDFEMTDQEFVSTIQRDTRAGGKGTSLSKLVSWPELYDNYPQLKDYRVRFVDQRGAYFNAEDREIGVSIDYLDSPLQLKEVLSHELQHGVQFFDNTIRGSNPSWVKAHDPVMKEKTRELMKLVKEKGRDSEEVVEAWDQFNREVFNRYRANEGEIEARGAGLMNYMSQEEIDEMLPSEIKRMALPKEEDQFRGSVMQAPGYAEGGAVTEMKVDPVSGNEVPPGVEPKNVRDDIDAKLSEGEYVIPADVVKYFGVAHFEKLIGKAKDGLKEMQSNGRMGGEPSKAEPEDDLPFSDEELTAEDEPVKMAEGGPVFDPSTFTTGFSTFGGGATTRMFIDSNGNRRSIMYINGQPIQRIPNGFVEDTPENRATLATTAEAVQEVAPQEPREESRAGRGEEDDYGLQTKADYSTMSPEGIQKELKAGQALSGLVGGLMGGPLAARGVKSLVEREQAKELEEQGLDPKDYGLKTKEKSKETKNPISDVLDAINPKRQNRYDSIGPDAEGNEGKTSKPDFDTPSTPSNGNSGNSGNSGNGGSYGYGSGHSDDKDDSRKSSSSYNKGGLVKKRPPNKRKKTLKRKGLGVKR